MRCPGHTIHSGYQELCAIEIIKNIIGRENSRHFQGLLQGNHKVGFERINHLGINSTQRSKKSLENL